MKHHDTSHSKLNFAYWDSFGFNEKKKERGETPLGKKNKVRHKSADRFSKEKKIFESKKKKMADRKKKKKLEH